MFTGSLSPASNRADWIADVYIYDDSDALVDLTGATIVFELRENCGGSALLSATTANGKITITGTGIFRWSFDADEMSDIDPGDYSVGCTLLLDSVTRQLFSAKITIIDGVVS